MPSEQSKPYQRQAQVLRGAIPQFGPQPILSNRKLWIHFTEFM
jgi:hypothetical protein